MNLNRLDALIQQRRESQSKKWKTSPLVYDIFWALMEGHELDTCFHLPLPLFSGDESLQTRFGNAFPQLAWVEETQHYWYLLTRKGWEKIWRDRLKYYRRGNRHRFPQWKRDRDVAEKAKWDQFYEEQKQKGNYLYG